MPKPSALDPVTSTRFAGASVQAPERDGAAAGGDGGPQPALLVHVTTVALSLRLFLRGQVAYMRERGIETQAVSSPGEDLAVFGAENDIVVHAVEMPRRLTPFRDALAVWRLVALMRRLRPDVVHAHTPKGGLLGMIAARLAGVPARIYHMRGLPFTGYGGPRRRLLRTTERVSCALAQRVICVSRSLRDEALREGICRADKITVLAGGSGQGVDAAGRFDPARLAPGEALAVRARLGIPAGAVVVGFVGRIVRDKGIMELAEAWTALRGALPELHLLLVGPLEPHDPIPPGVLQQLEGDPRVHFTGMDWNTPPLFAAMDVVALPSYREGFPNVPLEAGAMEKPVVATAITGCQDAVEDGVTGTLVPPRDAASLAGALRRYAESAELRHRHGTAGRTRVLREFPREALVQAIHQEYAALLAARGKR